MDRKCRNLAWRSTGCLASVAALLVCLASVSAAEQRLQGTDDGRPPPFRVDGPWLLEWRTRSEFPLRSTIEIRLFDADENYLGKVAEHEGTGSGVKFFEAPGTYRLTIIGKFVDWDIVIDEVDEDRAAILKRRTAGTPSILDSAREYSRVVPQSGFQSWRPESEETLLLFNNGVLAWRVVFSPRCTGLADATALSFIYRTGEGETATYDAILLDNGQRCDFHTVTPARLD
jgi:hypothetical protein